MASKRGRKKATKRAKTSKKTKGMNTTDNPIFWLAVIAIGFILFVYVF